MAEPKIQRVRDPVHGLIAFDKANPVDCLAWQLIDTPEFQRLRRIKQLGVSEFVFPGAVHTRFAHCIGVFHTARTLVKIIERGIHEIGEEANQERAEVAMIAALLHDLGHGPFSHTFEGVQKKRGAKKRHEKWTAEIIRSPEGCIYPLLEAHRAGFAEEVATLLASEDPTDIYHAVVSSSFDADRLDYLQRDRLMTGTGAGAIDLDWLLEHVRVKIIGLEAVDAYDEDHGPKAPTFCLDSKALAAAEQFLLARYTLHEQVYFHKTTRCVEHMIAKLLTLVSMYAHKPASAVKATGLPKDHPLLKFFSKDGETIQNYLSLDDMIVLGSLEQMSKAEDVDIAQIASRLRERRLYKTLDTKSFGADDGRRLRAARRIDKYFEDKIKSNSVIKDEGASINIYTQVGGDDEKAHKKLRILDGASKAHEITSISRYIGKLAEKHSLTRYYFEHEEDREIARIHGDKG